MFKKLKQNHNGQGIVEVMVAISVITVGLVGTLSLTSSSLRFSKTSEKQIVAANLAREGIEAVRNIRDSNWLQGNSWTDGLEDGTDYDGVLRFSTTTPFNTWYMDFSVDAIDEMGTDMMINSEEMYISELDGPNGMNSGYSRFIYMQLICEGGSGTVLRGSGFNCPGGHTQTGINVQVRVDWFENENTKSFIIEDNLYNWRDVQE